MVENYNEQHNKHHVRVDERSRILYGFSDAFEQPQEGDVLHNEQGGRHFQLRLKTDEGGVYSEENPPLRNDWGIPLYTLDEDGMAELRPSGDMEADRPPPGTMPLSNAELTDMVNKIREVLREELGRDIDG